MCVNDSRLQQLIPPATASMITCRKCNRYIAFHFHQADLKRKLAEAQNNIALVFYSTLMAIKDDISHELPKFRGIVFTLSSLFGDTPEKQEKIREMIDDGGPLLIPGKTLEELFTQGVSSQRRLKNVFSALEERLAGIQAASSDTRTQVRMIGNLKQAMHDFLQSSLPLYRFSSQRLAEIKDHPKTRRLLIEAKEQIRQDEIAAARRLQEEEDRKRYQALLGSDENTPAFALVGSGAHLGQFSSQTQSSTSSPSKSSSKPPNGPNSILSAAWNSISSKHSEQKHFIPEISGIIPAICPSMGGLPLSIKGFNFHPDARVFIANRRLEEWQVLWKSPNELTIISPQLELEGPVDISVENPNQEQRGVLEDVLFYTNDPTIMETVFGTAALDMDKPAPVKHGQTHTSASQSSSSSSHVHTSQSQPKMMTSTFSRSSTPAAATTYSPPSSPSKMDAPPSYSSISSHMSSTPPVYPSQPPIFSSSPPQNSGPSPMAPVEPPSPGRTHIRARTFGQKPKDISLDNSGPI